jgi:hypothetical protein
MRDGDYGSGVGGVRGVARRRDAVTPFGERALIQVWWTDTTNVAGGWHDEEGLAGFATDGAWKSSNTGWLVYEDEQCIVLAARMTEDGKHVGLVERIPKAAITSRTVWSSPASPVTADP